MVFCSASLSRAQSGPVEVSSPDHRITLHFSVQPAKGGEAGQDGQLMYSVKFRDKQVFEDSALRLELANQPPLGAAVHIADSTSGSGIDDYTLRGNVDVPKLARYAATKNVKVWIWLYSKAVAAQMQEAFPLYEKWGWRA